MTTLPPASSKKNRAVAGQQLIQIIKSSSTPELSAVVTR